MNTVDATIAAATVAVMIVLVCIYRRIERSLGALGCARSRVRRFSARNVSIADYTSGTDGGHGQDAVLGRHTGSSR